MLCVGGITFCESKTANGQTEKKSNAKMTNNMELTGFRRDQ